MKKAHINKLLEEGTFDGKMLNGKLIETHISWVILTKKFAFKIKKPLQYSFLNFSSLDKRKYYCERELTLNRRLTSIYLNVLPVKQSNGRIFIGKGEGKVIDYALRMRRLQAARKMDNMLQKNQINEAHMETLANIIAAFHQRADVNYSPFSKTKAKKAFNDILGVVGWVREHLGNKYAIIIEKSVSRSNNFLDRISPLLKKRIKNSLQRDVHGDLHSKNIFLYRKPIIFDCIEFNDDFRQIDVLNEVAFFCMDLESFQHWNLSKHFMKCYLDLFPCMNSQEDEQLFSYYKGYRANIRAKVNALRGMQTKNDVQIKKYAEEVRKYLNLLNHYISEKPS